MKRLRCPDWRSRAHTLVAFCAISGAAAAAGAVIGEARTPRSGNLLQASRRNGGSGVASAYNEDGGRQQPSEFFIKDFERMDELPEYNISNKKQCHPKCTWTCGTSNCNSHCHPRCQPPKCVTACKKPTMAKCKRVCKDPQCAVVCPPQCEHGTCPKCKTVCGKPTCELECGQGRCESQCADPDCVWDCAPDPVCAKPLCKMSCDTTVCTFGKDQKLPTRAETPYLGEEVAWTGLGKIPTEHLAEFRSETPTKVQMPQGPPAMLGGPKPLPKEGLGSISGKTTVQAEPEILKNVMWTGHMPIEHRVMAPSRLTSAR